MSGRQSTSIALLDATRSGIVLSSIHHRDSARLYAKQVHAGRGRARALARGERGDPARARGPSRRRARAAGSAAPAHTVGSSAMRVGYLGPEGTFTHEAALAAARAAGGFELVPHRDDLRHRDGGRRRQPSTGRWSRSRTRSRARSVPRSTRSRSRPTQRRDRRRERAPDRSSA